MIKTVICSNNNTLNIKLKNLLLTHINSIKDNKKHLILTFLTVEEMKEYWMFNKDIDLLFINSDILEIPIINEIQKEADLKTILLVPNFIELINIYYIIRPCSFLINPFSSKLLIKEFEYAKNKILLQQPEKYIIEKNEKGIFKIYVKDIVFIETFKRNTLIHTKEAFILSYKTLKTFEKILDNNFYRIHESYLINMNSIIEISALTVTLDTMDKLSLSKHRKKKFLDIYKYYINSIYI